MPSEGRLDPTEQLARIAEYTAPLAKEFGEFAITRSLAPDLVAAATAWLNQTIAAGSDVGKVKASHPYNFAARDLGYDGRAAGMLTDFLNTMAKAGVSEEDAAAMVRWEADRARAGPLIAPPAAKAAAKPSAADGELARLERLMGDKRSAYWFGAKAAALQARARELYAAKDGA